MLVAVAGIALYLLVILREVPGALEERFGKYEGLPEDVNQWRTDQESAEGKTARGLGLQREVRLFFAESKPDRLLRQVRYRNVATLEIERVEPDMTIKRKRRRA